MIVDFTTTPVQHFTKLGELRDAIVAADTKSIGSYPLQNLSVDATGHLNAHEESGGVIESWALTANGATQIAAMAGIASPMKNIDSYNRRNAFGDIAALINAGLQRAGQVDGEPRRGQIIVRDRKVAAVATPTYRLVTHRELVELAPLAEAAGLTFYKGELTDGFADLKFLSPMPEFTVRVGDPVKYGFSLLNSETGDTTVWLGSALYQLQCKNGATMRVGGQDLYNHKHTSGIDLELMLKAMLAYRQQAEEIISWVPKLAATPLEPVYGFIEDRIQRIFGKTKAITEGGKESKAVGVEILDAVKVAPDAYAAYSLLTNRAIHIKNRDAGQQLQRLGGDLLQYAGQLGARLTAIPAATAIDSVSLN